VALVGGGLLKWQEAQRAKSAKGAILTAFRLLVDAEKRMLRRKQVPLMKRAGIPGTSEELLNAVWSSKAVVSGSFLTEVDEDELAPLCADAMTSGIGKRARQKVERDIGKRLEFYRKLDAEGMRRYVTPQFGNMRAAQVLALLTDLPPVWIHDVSTGRRGGGDAGENAQRRLTGLPT
jgi:hypothetical protein